MMTKSTSERRIGRGTGYLWAMVLGCLFCLQAPHALFAQSKAADPIAPEILELLETHCFGCHGNKDPDAGLDLQHFRTVGSVRFEREIWEKVLRRVAAGSMPPVDAGEVPEAEREQLARWVDSALHDIDCSDSAQPGHMTIRRLNRHEYRNTILDLLKVDFATADSFPGDDAGYGFDNIGDVLSLPPVLMEKYLAAAEAISREVIPAPEDSIPVENPLELSQWQVAGEVNGLHDGLAFYTTGEATFAHEARAAWEGSVRIRVVGFQAGDEACRMTLYVDKKKVRSWTIRNHEQQETVEAPLKLNRGKRTFRLVFENDFYDPAAPEGKRDRNLVVKGVALLGEGEATAEVGPAQKNFCFVTPADRSEEEAAARKILSVWASRFFRRPASAAEADRLVQVYREARSDGSSYQQSLQYGLQAILVSPKFLYKVERPAPVDGTPQPLNSFEMATNLAFFLWHAGPDEALLKTAMQQDLQDEAVLQREVLRMMADPRHDRMIGSFVSQWLQLRALERSTPDPVQYPGVDRQLLDDMSEESVLFCREIFRSDRNLLELLSADFTIVNQRLAKHYGLTGIPAGEPGFIQVSLTDSPRRGLLTHGSILTVTSNPNRTSPVKRGRWILENILGEPPPPALPDIMPLEQQELKGTLRQRMEQHRADPSCASCHSVMDPLGFALENFDGVGRWRTEEDGQPIDASGELPSGEVFDGAVGLLEILQQEKKDKFLRCLTEKMLIYALGRGLRYQDQCAVNEIQAQLEASGFRYSALIHGIVQSKPFRQRQANSGE